MKKELNLKQQKQTIRKLAKKNNYLFKDIEKESQNEKSSNFRF